MLCQKALHAPSGTPLGMLARPLYFSFVIVAVFADPSLFNPVIALLITKFNFTITLL